LQVLPRDQKCTGYLMNDLLLWCDLDTVTSAIKDLAVLPDLNLLVKFSGGVVKKVDFKPILAGTSSPLLQQDFFAKVRLIRGFPTWPGQIDIEPEDLFILGEDYQKSS